MFFSKISNVDILFTKKILIWKFYTTNKALFITKKVQIIDTKEFVIVVFDENSKIFMVYIAIRK